MSEKYENGSRRYTTVLKKYAERNDYHGERAKKRLAAKKKNKRINTILTVIIIVAAAVFIYAAVNIIFILAGYAKAKETYKATAEEVFTIVEMEDNDSAEDEVEEGRLFFDFDLLKAKCEYAVGYIYQKDFLSYPIVQYTDNEYYLNHLIDGTYNSNGTLFVEYKNSGGLDDRNSIIYGHNMNDGSMLGSLKRYTDESYFQEYPEMDVFVGYTHYVYKVFSVYTADVGGLTYQYEFSSDDEFCAYLDYVKSQSLYDTGVTGYGVDSKVITLSTCTSNSADKYRFVVILIRDREESNRSED